MATLTARGQASSQKLLAAAANDLVEHFGELEVQRVADRAGVSVGLIYRHFGSKAGLVRAVVEDFYDRYDSEVFDTNPVPGAGWSTREHERTARFVHFFYGEPLAPAVLLHLSRQPEVAATEAARIARHIEMAARNLALGQARGEIPADLDTGIVGAMVLGGLRQAMAEALRRPMRPPPETMIGELWRVIVAAVRFQAGKNPTARSLPLSATQ